ncbi:hypothetical protein HQ533_06380 [Candidatus Woesearchaeota archaeon]|nr:hypothetical protein [Candidatus Woesearchaeota archaeon]
MTTIVVNGLPKIGKTGIAERVQQLYRDNFNSDLGVVSLGDTFSKIAEELYGVSSRKVPSMQYNVKQGLRIAAVERVAKNLLREDLDRFQRAVNERKSVVKENPLIIETPITVYEEEGGVPDIVRDFKDFQEFNNIRNIDAMVTIIDSPQSLAGRLEGTTYPYDWFTLLDWEGFETETARSHAKSLSTRHLVIPRHHAELSLLKLIFDIEHNRDPTIVYNARPITDLKDKPGDSDDFLAKKANARSSINVFAENLEQYSIVVVPIEAVNESNIEILKSYERKRFREKERDHTIRRDIGYFVPNSNLVVAFFPYISNFNIEKPFKYESTGTEDEMRNSRIIAKPVVLIVGGEQDKKVFGLRPTAHFTRDHYLFKALGDLENSKYRDDITVKKDLSLLLEDGKPKYHEFGKIISEIYHPKN